MYRPLYTVSDKSIGPLINLLFTYHISCFKVNQSLPNFHESFIRMFTLRMFLKFGEKLRNKKVMIRNVKITQKSCAKIIGPVQKILK